MWIDDWSGTDISHAIFITHSSAPNALCFVCARISLNVLTTTAVSRLINQKFRTMTATMKYRQEAKNSASIDEYMSGAQVLTSVSF